MTPKAWLDSERDYEVGRLLYAALGDNERLKRLFRGGPNHYNLEALAWEVGKLAKTAPGAVVVPVAAPVVESIPATLPAEPIPAPLASPLLDELRAARRPLYDERTGLHGQLEALDSDEARHQMAIEVMKLSRQIDKNWDTTRYVTAHGQLPPPPAPAPGLDTLPAADLLKRRNNLRSQVSKLKNKPHRADDLVRIEAELNQVEKLLK